MKKQIVAFLSVFCLFCGGKVFSQCIVSSSKLKAPKTYQSIEEMKKDYKTLEKASKSVELEIRIPIGSPIRNTITAIFSEVFHEKSFEGLYNDYFSSSDDLPERIKFADEQKKDICLYLIHDKSISQNYLLSDVTGLLSKQEYYQQMKEKMEEEIDSNYSSGYGSVTNSERDAIIAQINTLKTEYNEKINLMFKEAREKNEKLPEDCQNKARENESNKEWASALANYYYGSYYGFKIPAEIDTLTTEYTRKRNKIICKINNIKTTVRWDKELNREIIVPDSKVPYTKIELEYEKSAMLDKYNELANIIKSGIPGPGEYSAFALHDGWKKLLMNAEQVGTEYSRYKFEIGKLKQKEIDYSKHTATYSATITLKDSVFYENIIKIIKEGYAKAWRKDWKDLPKPNHWPIVSASGANSNSNLVNGVAVYRSSVARYRHDIEDQIENYTSEKVDITSGVYNAFACEKGGDGAILETTLYDLQFVIVDEKGKELVKPKRELMMIKDSRRFTNGMFENSVEIPEITPDVMDKIDSGKASIKLINVYLEYGTYNKIDDSIATTGNQRAFMKNFPEIKLSLDKVDFKYMKE
ncbi:MAG: hypothetical protein IJ530_01680 [Treponema sp.]|uniref:hypothetical protein n=1 Tax=Treponema sp. TaxID=166 RepID=UPI0025F570AD|nr:hypothetical protein [Treponema sp.]MBQ8678451.1 hypothetical protein [Treponema sp.]